MIIVIKGTRTSNYLKGLASGYVVTFATIVVGLFLVPFVLRYLDREQYAVFTLAGEVLMWLGLMELGITAVLNVKAAQLSGKPDQEQLNRLASTTFFAQCGIALLIGLVGFSVSRFFPDFFQLRPDLHRDAMLLMGLMVVGAALKVGTQTFSALLIGHQQIHVDNAIRLGLLVIRTVLTVWLLMNGFGLLSLAIAHLAAVVITGFFSVIRVYRLLPALSLRWRYFSWDILKQTGGLGIWFSLGGLAGILIMNLDKIMTAKIVSIEMVTTLALTGRLYLLAWQLLQQVTNTARPALAQIVGEGKKEHALAKYRQLTVLSTALAFIGAGSIWAGNASFVTWWVGPVNYGGVWLDGFLALNLLVHAWVLPGRAILVAGMAFVPQNAMSRFVEGGMNLGFSLILGHYFGIVGIAAATTISGLLGTCWYFPVLTSRFFKIPLTKIYGDSLRRLAFVGVSMMIISLASRAFGQMFGGFQGALISGLISAILGVLTLWFICISAEDRVSYKKLITIRFCSKQRII